MKVSKRLFYVLTVCLLTVALNVGSFIVPASAQDTGIKNLKETGKAFRSVAKQVSPAVVFIKVETEVQQQAGNNSFEGTPFGDEFFRRFFGQIPQQQAPRQAPRHHATAQGSGFLISADGYIMTNNHVVGHADKVTVQLLDGRDFDAKIVGTDPATDIALIKINADEKLPFLKLGDSDKLEVGDWVLAFGNPFGLSHTLTAGIVSAKGRSGIGLSDYENFIQTDAAINPGNSGGPLVNLDGEVVGMNSAIFTRSGGYMGIGFAIPINMAKNVRDQLIEHGTVKRGRLGVYIQDLTKELADSFGIDQREGILVSQVMADSPAAKAGLQQGDVILALNGDKVDKVSKFRNKIAFTSPGTKVKLLVLRDGKKETIVAEIGTLETDQQGHAVSADALPKLGMTLQGLTPELADQLGYQNASGVVVTAVESGSIAAQAGIKRGDLIEEVNRTQVKTPAQVKQLIKDSNKKTVLLLVRQGDASRYLALKLAD